MRSFHRLALLALPLICSVTGNESPANPTKSLQNDGKPFYANANEAFQELLNALPEDSLHVALESLKGFKEGIFESHRHGVEHIHQDNPPLATKLIVAAVQDLKRRQAPAPTNGTTPTAPTQQSQQPSETPSSQAPPPSSQKPPASSQAPPPSSAAPPRSSADAPVVVPVPVTTTDSNGQATVISSAILSEPTASVEIQVTRTDSRGQTTVAVETQPAVIFEATDSAGSSFLTTSAVGRLPTAGQVMTATDGQGRTLLTTYTPGGGRISSILLVTTTGSNGEPSVVTSYTFVEPAAVTGSDGLPASTTTKKPSVQSGAANKNWGREAAVAGAFGGVLALWI